MPSVVRDYETGLLVDPGDVGQLALALQFLLRDEVLLGQMSDQARRMIHQRFRWSAIATEYVGMYRSLAAGPAPHARLAPRPAVLTQPTPESVNS